MTTADTRTRIRTRGALHRRPEGERLVTAIQFMHRRVAVNYGYLRDGSQTAVGRVLAVATVDHGTCTAVLVLSGVEGRPVVDGEPLPHAVPLSQITDIIEIAETEA